MLKKLTAMLTAIVLVVGMIAVPTRAENVQYTDITIESIYTAGGEWHIPQIHPGREWRIYLRPSIDLADRIGIYHLTINNGVEDRVVDFYVEEGSTNQIYTINLPKDFVNADGTQTLTFKKGTYQADSKQYGINLTQDFAIYINNGSWSSDQSKVNPTSGGNANLTLNLTPNDTITTGGSANGFYLTADIETDAQVTNDNWAPDYDLKPLESATDGSVFHLGSGIFKGDAKLSYRLIKYTKTGYYVETTGGAETNVEYTVKGLFKDKNGKVFGFNPVTVSWDGSKWTQKKVETPDTDVTTYDTTLTTEGAGGWDTANTGKNIIYMHGSDNYLSDQGENWDSANRQLTAADDNSGAWLGDKKLQKIEFKKIVGGVEVWNATSVYFIKYNDTDVTVAQDTILTIKGTFVTGDNKAKIQVAESKFQWNGSKWESYKAPQQYTGKLTLDGAGWYATNANNESTKLYVHGTDTYLDSEGEGWNEDRRVFLPEDDESGIYIGNRRWPKLEFQKFMGGVADGAKHMWYITKFSAKEGQVLTVKGNFVSKDGKVKINITESKFVWTGAIWQEYVPPVPSNETDRTLKLDTETNNGGNEKGIYLLTDDGFEVDGTWAKQIKAVAEAGTGIYYNDKKIDAPLFKYTDGRVYLGLNNAEIIAKDKDKVVIKGTFILDDYRVSYKEVTFYYNGQVWATTYQAPKKVVYTDITLDKVLDVTGYRDENERYDIYVSTQGKLPGEGDKIRFDGINITVDGQAYTIGAYHAAHEDSFFFILDNTMLAKNLKKNTKIVVKAGTYLSNDVTKGIVIKKDFTIYANKYGFSEKEFLTDYVQLNKNNENNKVLKLDTATNNGGNENGIYLTTNDGFKVDETWVNQIKAADEANAGVYLNGTKIDAPIFKYTDGHAYLGLVNGGVTAKDKDKVVIKGSFVLNNYRVGYKEVTFYYNGQVWATTYKAPKKVTYTDITLDEMLDVTMYRDAEERWDIYLSTKGKLPGEGDKISFEKINITIDGQPYTIGAYHAAHEDSFFFILDKTMLSKKPAKNTKIVIKAGKYLSNDVTKGIRIKKDYTIYANKYGISNKNFLSELIPAKKNIKLEIDRDLLYGGDGNGIFLITGDKFPTDNTWQSSIRTVAYDDNSGVFYNGKRTDAVLKKFEDGKIYIGLVDGGVVAKDGDKVVIKGLFKIGEHVMSYAEHTFYYNGKTWNTTYFKQKTKRVKISGVSINEVTSYDAERKWWNVYVNLKGKLPGEIDKTQFNGLDIIVNGKMLESKTTFHSYMDTLYFPIPEEYLAEDAKNGIEIVIKKGKAEASDRINEIIWTEDFKFYTFAGSLTEVKPTTNTKWVKSEISLFKTAPYHEDWNAWQVLVAVKEPFNTESGTYYYQLPVEINGKKYKVRAIQSGTNLAFDVTKDMVDPNSNNGVIKIKAGATALANAGKDGVHLTNDLTVYLFNKTWSDKKYTKVSNVDVNMVGVQDSTYVKNPDGSAYTNMYVWMDAKMPGRAWFESYLVPVLYNGKEVTVQMERVVSKFGRLMYFGLTGTPKDGDTVTFKAGTKAEAGGIGFTIKNTYTLIYKNGQWSEYVKSDVQKPKAEKSLWDVARFDSSYIPYTKSGVVTFSNTDKNSVITSVEPMKDYTIKFKARKLDDNDESSPNFSVMLRANAIDDKTPVSTDALYGYVVTFQYNQLSLYKNHVNWELTDAYRLAYEPLEENEKFFEFGEDYEYEFSIYNVTDTCACITISVNGVEQIRYYDHASEDAKDPVVNAGDFRIYAECTTAIMSSVATTDELIISEETTETNKGVYVAASYPYVDEDTEFTVSGTGAFVEDGIFKATEPGTYTVSATYKGKAVEPKTITVTAAEKKTDASEEEVIYEEVINWPVVIGMAAGAVVVLLALVLVVIKLKKKKTGKSEVE